jgi:MazG family protein
MPETVFPRPGACPAQDAGRVPPHRKESVISSFPELGRLLDTLRHLRGPDGCPWDRKQTLADMCRYLLDETYELQDAIADEDRPEILKELGDVLFLVLSCNLILEESGQATLEQVARAAHDKIVRRHPHVFGDREAARNADESLRNWRDIKAEEARERGEPDPHLLQNIPKTLPPVRRAWTVQKKVASVGFEWDTVEGVFDKLVEETNEIRAEMAGGDKARIQDEVGDLLFSAVNLARYLAVDPERALQGTVSKFSRRFHEVENALRDKNRSLEDATLQEMDALWDEVKERERQD